MDGKCYHIAYMDPMGMINDIMILTVIFNG